MSDLEFSVIYCYLDHEFLDLRKIRYIIFEFDEIYTKKSIKVDLYPSLKCNVLHEEEEKNLGTGILTAKVNAPYSIYPNCFKVNGEILMEKFKQGENISNIRCPFLTTEVLSSVPLMEMELIVMPFLIY